jgi:hypothetical protein
MRQQSLHQADLEQSEMKLRKEEKLLGQAEINLDLQENFIADLVFEKELLTSELSEIMRKNGELNKVVHWHEVDEEANEKEINKLNGKLAHCLKSKTIVSGFDDDDDSAEAQLDFKYKARKAIKAREEEYADLERTFEGFMRETEVVTMERKEKDEELIAENIFMREREATIKDERDHARKLQMVASSGWGKSKTDLAAAQKEIREGKQRERELIREFERREHYLVREFERRRGGGKIEESRAEPAMTQSAKKCKRKGRRSPKKEQQPILHTSNRFRSLAEAQTWEPLIDSTLINSTRQNDAKIESWRKRVLYAGIRVRSRRGKIGLTSSREVVIS